ncbi:MAG: FMN-dependent NADH-azoreductase [Paracoccaceae bacterium]
MTNTILQIDVSPRGAESVTRKLTQNVVERLAPDTIIMRDLTRSLPHLDSDWIGANFTPANDHTAEQRALLRISDTLVDEIRRADTIVIGLPVWNFGIPAALKAWVDLVARAGETFRYTKDGPQGLLTGKRAILALASGGTAVDSEIDFATPYMRHVLGFIGITDVSVVAADQMALDPEASLKAADEAVLNLAA